MDECMFAPPLQKASRSLPCGIGWNGGWCSMGSGRPTLGAPPCSSFPPPENHPGMSVPPRAPARDDQHGSTAPWLHGSMASTQRMRQWLSHRHQFSYPGPPRRANPRRWAGQGKYGCDQSLLPVRLWSPSTPFSFLFQGCRLGHQATWIVADEPPISYRWLGIVSGLLEWLGCLGGNGKGNRRELGRWAEESRRVTRGTLTAVGCR
jgi:hypothetical protein